MSISYRTLRINLVALILGVCGMCIAPGVLHAQRRADPQPSRNETLRSLQEFADSARMPDPYIRERFTYPRTDRPDPVMPPPVIAKREEALPTLLLMAIIYDENTPQRSTAVVRVGDRGGRQHRVTAGDRIGEIEVLSVHPKMVIVGLRKLGQMQTDTLSLERSRP